MSYEILLWKRITTMTNMSSLLLFLSRFKEEDKIKHLIWSFWITVVALSFLTSAVSILFVFSIGVMKEIWDHYYGSGFCFYDISANCLGIFLATILYYAIIFGMAVI